MYPKPAKSQQVVVSPLRNKLTIKVERGAHVLPSLIDYQSEIINMNNKFSIIPVLVLLTSISYANDLSSPGFTGSIRTPNANIPSPGKLQYQYNNYNDLNSRSDNTYNHVFAVGINSYIEFGGRLTNWYNDDRAKATNGTLPGKRDLSGNLKFRLPKAHQLLPELAIGIQDFGGEAVNFRSTYGVASKEIGRTTVSVGYAKSDTGALNGKFGSIDIKLSPNTTLKADYLDETFAVGLGIDTKKFTKLPVTIELAGEKQKNGEWKELIGLTLTLPLDKKFEVPNNKLSDYKLTQQSRNIANFIKSLEVSGLMHAKLGTLGAIDVLLIENHVYNHSYLDALAVALGNAYKHLGGKNNLQILLLKQNTPLIAVQVDMREYGKFINGQPSDIKKTIKAWSPKQAGINKVTWHAQTRHANRSPIDMRIQPELKSNLGSEWGVFDYSAAIRADVKIPLGKMADLIVSGSIPIAHSDLYDDGGAFASSRHTAKIKQAVLQKLVKPTPSSTILASTGYSTISENEYLLGQIESTHSFSSGKSQIFTKMGYYNSQNRVINDEIIALGGLRHHINFLDMDAEISYGQFYSETRGVKAKISRFYGDAELSAELKYVDTDDMSGRLSISIPLTPRKDRIAGNTVFRGSQSWNYGIETTIKDPVVVGSNRVRPSFMLEPSLSHTLEKDYLDNSRLSPNHLMDNIHQLRQRSVGLVNNN